ncbi:uncharacterized protein I303_102226 [Kwoniella dejecticola CBS 10117]|uniref:Zn(2)-C6 fungal-type domain-containing protein n=1 Tax=Kwoniella dejecticola CBS 10117 TaxID=1296121 RepID=A0A1A6ABJ4_9TREE|nr:uncharacterized protein I303_01634 [Kwoniella dejecticola CBS 10117]OBR87432.1 hypothetical protein I303_01634 [Kwoniella dejecticola CBS 10117]
MHRNNSYSSHPDDHPSTSSRYPPPPPPPLSSLNGASGPAASGRPSTSFYLPPPIPSAKSPMNHSFGGSPGYGRDNHAQSPSGGHTDPQSWASNGLDRPSSSRAKSSSGWNPSNSGPSPRDTSGNRLPPLADLQHPSSRSHPPGWDVPSPGSYTMSNARGSGSTSVSSHYQHPHQQQQQNYHHQHSPSYRDSPSKPPHLITPVTSSHGPHWAVDNREMSPGMSRRESIVSQASAPARGSHFEDSPTIEESAPTSQSNSKGKHAAPSSGKEDNEGGSQAQKKKKRRVALSCAECAKRKQKCNRETPCQHCVARRVPELCVPYSRPATPPGGKGIKTEITSAKPSPSTARKDGENPPTVVVAQTTTSRPPSMLPTISVRVARLEAMVNAVVNRVEGVEGKALRDWRINHAPATTPPPLSAELPPDSEDEKKIDSSRPETSSTLSRKERSVEWDEDNGPGSEDAVVGGLDRETGVRNPLPQSLHDTGPVPLGLDYHGTPAEQLSKLFNDCGLNPAKMTKLLKDLPPRDLAEKITQWFFEKVNYVRYPIDEHLFRIAVESVYAKNSGAGAVLALPLVFIVFALSTRVAPDELVGDEQEKRLTSLRYYWNSKTAINIASAVKSENLHLVETRICTGLYLVLMHERRLAEGWAEFRYALTMGQALGLHRDGTKLGLDPYVTEYRRRLWSYLIHADATYSCLLGRPTAIDVNFADTLSPSNIDLSALRENKKAVPQPMTEPTFATYLILRGGLGRIVAKVTQHFQRLSGQNSSYKDVEALDAEFKQFVDSLPPTYKMLTPDKSYDKKLWFLPIHRYYIQTEILHFTIILHRPWLLRKLRSSRYALSRQACFDAAIKDYKLRQMFKVDCPDFFETLLGGSFREFNVAMIAGISIIIDPRASRAAEMKQIIQSFMEQHPHDPKMDDFSQKEAAIIYTLHQRAQQMESQRLAKKSITSHSGRLSVDNTSFERSTSKPPSGSSMGAPPNPTPPHSSDGSGGPRNAPLPAISPQSFVRASPYNTSLGPTPPGMGTSPEEDHPQRLLDHWLQSNTFFGPGTEGPNFGVGLYQQQPLQLSSTRNNSLTGIDPLTNPNAQAINFNVDPSQAHLPQDGTPYTVNPGFVDGGFGSTADTGPMGWMDPSLASSGPMMGTFSSQPLPQSQSQSQQQAMTNGNGGPMQMDMMGMGPPMDNMLTMNNGGVAGIGQGLIAQNQGGNSSQYWNALIDGIVTGLPTYDANLGSTSM